jgi:hypothetical protein
VAFDASGNALAVWDRSNGTNQIVQSSFRPAGGAFAAPVDLSATGQDASAPQVAFGASGKAIAVWQRSNGTNEIVQAAFAAHTLSVSTAGSGSGSVTGGAITCPGTCSHAYPEGTLVALIAAPAAGSTFTGWSGGGCTGTAGCSVTMSADQSVTATFNRVVVAPAPIVVVVAPAPIVSAAGESAKAWREGPALVRITAAKRDKRAPVGTTFSFTVNEPASVSFAFTQQVSGRNIKGKCVAQSPKNRHSHPCRRTVTHGTLTLAAHQGLDKVRFAGRISARHKLGLGRYTLTITATNAQGKTAPRSLSFTIVR